MKSLIHLSTQTYTLPSERESIIIIYHTKYMCACGNTAYLLIFALSHLHAYTNINLALYIHTTKCEYEGVFVTDVIACRRLKYTSALTADSWPPNSWQLSNKLNTRI